MNGGGFAAQMPHSGDWVKYKLTPASEWVKQMGADYVTLTIGAPARIDGVDLVWWQMTIDRQETEADKLMVQALSERAPMTREDGDIG